MVTEISQEGILSEHVQVTWMATTQIQWIVLPKQMADRDKRLYPRLPLGEDRVAVLHQLWQCKGTDGAEWRPVTMAVEQSLLDPV
jgi:hypothetical protein